MHTFKKRETKKNRSPKINQHTTGTTKTVIIEMVIEFALIGHIYSKIPFGG